MLSQTIRESFHNLWASKQRSLLALVGIVIGTGSVIAMGNIGAIAEKHALKQIRTTGIDMVVISIQQEDGSKKFPEVTAEDIKELAKEVPELIEAIPIVTGGQQMLYRGQPLFASTVASYPAVFDLAKLKLKKGRLLSLFDDLELFCVIGDQVIREEDSTWKAKVGDQIQIGSQFYSITGILAKADQSPLLPFEASSSIYVSFANARRVSGKSKINTVLGRMSPTATAEATTSQIKTFFEKRLPGVHARVHTATQLLKEMGQQVHTYSLLLGTIGSISLIVGGVGVMNVMLVSVTERRLEIGIRMAIGARRRDIKMMFLIESLVLSLVGGIIGTIIGVGSSAVFAGVLHWTFTLAGYAIPLGAGVSLVVGVFFGIYPAASAARLNPADVLKPQ